MSQYAILYHSNAKGHSRSPSQKTVHNFSLEGPTTFYLYDFHNHPLLH